MRAGAIRPPLQGPDAEDREESDWRCAATQSVGLGAVRADCSHSLRRKKMVTGQMPPPVWRQLDCPCGRPARTARCPGEAAGPRSGSWSPRLLCPVLREPHKGLVAGRESLASLDSAAANLRLAFLLRVERRPRHLVRPRAGQPHLPAVQPVRREACAPRAAIPSDVGLRHRDVAFTGGELIAVEIASPATG